MIQKAQKKVDDKLSFATYAESTTGLREAAVLAESIRDFGGRWADSSIFVYVPDTFDSEDSQVSDRLRQLRVEIRGSTRPADSAWLPYSGKTFAAGMAEEHVEGSLPQSVLVWMDSDTVLLKEPSDLALTSSQAFAYRPVMHNRSGSLHSEPPDDHWGRIYELLGIDPNRLFPMVTPADRQEIRAYFNAGLVAIRPEYRVLRKWGDCFQTLYRDEQLAAACRTDQTKAIFLHQTALVGAVLNTLDRDRMLALDDRYNYPIFFKEMFGAEVTFNSIAEVVTLRYDYYFRNPAPDWTEKLDGPLELIDWLAEHLK